MTTNTPKKKSEYSNQIAITFRGQNRIQLLFDLLSSTAVVSFKLIAKLGLVMTGRHAAWNAARLCAQLAQRQLSLVRGELKSIASTLPGSDDLSFDARVV